MRIGIGYDIHRLVPTVEPSAIPLGGVDVPCFYRIEAHSDGDVLLHALVDACLGSLALGDIGQWFPDNKIENRGRRSSEFVVEVMTHIRKIGWEVQQIDSTLLLEEPKITPHSKSIRNEIARLFGIGLTAVSVKAKTMEGLGPIGEKKAIAAHTVVLLTAVKS